MPTLERAEGRKRYGSRGARPTPFTGQWDPRRAPRRKWPLLRASGATATLQQEARRRRLRARGLALAGTPSCEPSPGRRWGRDWGLRIKSTAGFSPSAARPAPDRTSGCPGELRREDTCGQTGAAPRPGHRTPSRKAPGESFRLCQVGEALQVFPGSSCPVAAKSRSADPSPSVSPLWAEGARSDSFRRTGRRPSAVPGDRGPFALGSNCSPFRPQVKTLLLADTCFLNCISPPLVPVQETPRLIPEPLPCVV